VRIAHQLSILRDHLDPWRKMNDVANLRREIVQLPRSQAVIR
jgi:hypothetical protein